MPVSNWKTKLKSQKKIEQEIEEWAKSIRSKEIRRYVDNGHEVRVFEARGYMGNAYCS